MPSVSYPAAKTSGVGEATLCLEEQGPGGTKAGAIAHFSTCLCPPGPLLHISLPRPRVLAEQKKGTDLLAKGGPRVRTSVDF